MICSKCGAELSDDSKFCSYCGNEIEEEQVRIIQNIVEEPVTEGSLFESESTHVPEKKSIIDKLKAKINASWRKLSLYGKFATIALLVFSIMLFVAFILGRVYAEIIVLVSIVLMVVSILIKKGIIKVKKTWIYIISCVLAILLTIPYFLVFPIDYGDAEYYDWREIELCDAIPEPHINFGEIMKNSKKQFSVDIYKTNNKQYDKYVEDCKDWGYTIDADETEIEYIAFNSNGYKLTLYYHNDDNKMSLNLYAPEKYGTLEWSNDGIGKMIPTPESNIGRIDQDDEKGFKAYVAETTIDDYKAYVKKCADNGFATDVSKTEKHYFAKNSKGYRLTVDYQGYNVISVSIDEPEYEVNIKVKCSENLFFSKYDVEIYIDGEYEDTLEHGSTESYTAFFTKGTYKIKFIDDEDDDLTGEIKFDVRCDGDLELKISCSSSGIDVDVVEDTISTAQDDDGEEDDIEDDEEIEETEEKTENENMAYVPDVWTNLIEKHYEEVKKQFEDAGFTNIICMAHEIDYNEENVFEGSVVNIAIGENGENCTFEKDEQLPKDIKIRIDYRVNPIEEEPDTTKIVLPQENSKLGKDFDSKGTSTVYYVNVDGTSNVPTTTTWGNATVTDGVAEYLNYLQNLGFTVNVTDTTHKEPYSGFHTYDTVFKVSNDKVSWTMYLSIQKEYYVEYELDVYIK